MSDMTFHCMRTTHRGSLGYIDSADRAIIIGECENIPPVSVLDEEGLEQLAVTRCSCLRKF